MQACHLDDLLETCSCQSLVISAQLYCHLRKLPEYCEASSREMMTKGIFGKWRDRDIVPWMDKETPEIISMCSKNAFEIEGHAQPVYDDFWVDAHERIEYAKNHKDMNGLRCSIQPENIRGRIVASLSPKAMLVDIGKECVIAGTDCLKMFFL